jgi:hypothetical protein
VSDGPYVLVTGGRDYWDRRAVTYWLGWADGYLHPETPVLVHGDARGADRLAAQVAATDLRWRTVAVPADWKAHGRGAGLRRNQRMLDQYPVRFCLAFPGGNGTADMVRRCERAGVPVIGPDHGTPALAEPRVAFSGRHCLHPVDESSSTRCCLCGDWSDAGPFCSEARS